MYFINQIEQAVATAIRDIYQTHLHPDQITINITPQGYRGDFSVVTFPLGKLLRQPPEDIARQIGEYLMANLEIIHSFEVIKGFLNLQLKESPWLIFLKEHFKNQEYGKGQSSARIVIEYCGPNTNKPLHLGHVRNMLLGHSLSNILKWNGNTVFRVNMYNDRGIAICKSMVAWIKSSDRKTPESSGQKGDHLVGEYYVRFEKQYKAEVDALMQKGMPEEEARHQAPILLEAQEMLRKWEAGDSDTLRLWQQMNAWVYAGFEATYQRIGVEFDKHYYESQTYLLGKQLVMEGLEKNVFYRKPDGSVWVDLTDKGLDEKVLLRKDGTSVYLTQDLGTAQLRYDDFHMDQSIYVVANEQDYHFKALKCTLEKLGKPYAQGIYHLSYGMVDLPSGRMKSREGTVVDADDLLDELFATAEKHTLELGKIEEFTEEEARKLFRKIGLGALKFFILKVDPRKRMLFHPDESIDFHGHTGPFVQYTHARIHSVLRKAEQDAITVPDVYTIQPVERELLIHLHQFPSTIREAAGSYSPALVANYVYILAKTFNKFYTDYSILNAESEEARHFRLALSVFTARVIKDALHLLGIEAPEKM